MPQFRTRWLPVASGAALVVVMAVVFVKSPASSTSDAARPAAERRDDRSARWQRQPASGARWLHEEAPSEDGAAPLELVIRLGTDLREGLAVPVAVEAEWSAERVWPYPDELPEDPVIFALQEVFAATDEDRDAALDALDMALTHAEPSPSAWSALAAIEAERMLAKSAYEAELEVHTERLCAWSDGGGLGPMPEGPRPWSAQVLGRDVRHLSREVDAAELEPMALDLARLTEASMRLDWTAEGRNEAVAVGLLLDVVARTDDPAILAEAVRLLVGTRAPLSPASLDDLIEVLPDLPDTEARRLSWFLSDRWLEEGVSDRALDVLDVGLALEVTADLPVEEPLVDQLRQTRATLVARVDGRIEAPAEGSMSSTLEATVDALAWGCWLDLQAVGDPWVLDGTDYAGALVWDGTHAQWVDWTDQNPHQTCMADRLEPMEGPKEPAKVLVTVAVLGAP